MQASSHPLVASVAMTMTVRALAALSIFALLLGAACSKDGTLMGAAGDAAAVDEVIEISTTDRLRFDPDSVTVAAGETIEFEVTNGATGEHEFVLGPLHEHTAGMQHGDPSSTGVLESGDMGSVIWTFPEAGEVTFACYVEGHNEQGMTGTITITE
jgi:uncharacterized cupredoxin-like copper-binding protein